MISIITRPNGSDCHALYALAKSTKVTIKNGSETGGKLNTKIALGVTMSDDEWKETKDVLSSFESARKANRQVSYVGNPIILKIWEIKNELDAMLKAGFYDTGIAKEKIRVILHKEDIEKIEAEKKKAQEMNRLTILSYVEKQLNDYKSGKRCHCKTGLPLSKGTIDGREVWYRFFKRYLKDRHVNLTFDDIDFKFFDDFKSYMMNLKYKDGRDKPMRQNSIAAYVGVLRGFMSDAYADGVTRNDIFRNKRFKVAYTEVDNVALTEEQIDQLLTVDFTDKDYILSLCDKNIVNKDDDCREIPKWVTRKDFVRCYQTARDIFVVGCLTGQRFSDYSRINDGMYITIGGYTFLKIKQKKTGEEVKIPVDKRVDAILKKYDGKLPPHREDAMNKEIKRIGELLGWTDMVEMETTMGLVKKKLSVRFCDCISSHTARRTWATNAYKRGLSLSRIMTVTGHKSEACLRRYLRIEKNEDALMTANELSKFATLM